MFTFILNFPNGNVQTYPDAASMNNAAKAMGGEARAINTSGKDRFMHLSLRSKNDFEAVSKRFETALI